MPLPLLSAMTLSLFIQPATKRLPSLNVSVIVSRVPLNIVLGKQEPFHMGRFLTEELSLHQKWVSISYRHVTGLGQSGRIFICKSKLHTIKAVLKGSCIFTLHYMMNLSVVLLI